MEDNISKIKDKLDVVDVISGYLKVQKAGMNYKARCPFHNEKTPSFYISPERQIWHCFGCQAGGDIFGFVKQIEGVEFPEALRTLAQKAGVELKSFDPVMRDEKTKLHEICEKSAKFFEKQLWGGENGKKALAYLKDRGLAEDTVKDFRLGFAPDSWQALTNFLTDCGYSFEEIISSGVVIKRQTANSGVYDRFRSRIMFPICDVSGQVVGFTGRIFSAESQGGVQADPPKSKSFGGESVAEHSAGATSASSEVIVEAKYINTPQTLIYDKSRILYGLDKAKVEIKKANQCVLVEGNVDAIMSYQAGIKNVVASSGTALTQEHLRILERYTNNLGFCFDEDQAGAMATKRGIGLALNKKFNIKVVELDDKNCKDPADYVQKHGQDWSKLIDNSRSVLDYYFEKAKRNFNSAVPENKKNIVAVLAPFIKRLASQVEKSHWISQLAFFLRVGDEAVAADIASAKDDLEIYAGGANNESASLSVKKLEHLSGDIIGEELISVLLSRPKLFKEDLANVKPEFLNPETTNIIAELTKVDFDNFNFGGFVKKFDRDLAMKLEFAFIKSQEIWKDFKDEELKEEFSKLINSLKQKAVGIKLAAVGFEIRAAEAANDKEKVKLLAQKFSNLTQDLATTHK